MLLKNAIQKVHIYAYNSTTGAAKTGDALNITGYVSLDGVANAIDDTNPTEVDATNMPGVYAFDLTAAETNCDSWALYAKSVTANIRIEPLIGFTTAGSSTAIAADAIAISGDTTAADNCELMFDGTGYAGGTAKLNVNVAAQDNIDFGALQKASLNAATPAVTVSDKTGFSLSATGADLIASTSTFATAMAAAIWNALTSGMVTVGSIGKKLADWVVGTIDTYTGNTKQTGDAYAVVNHVTYGNSAIETLVDDLESRLTAGRAEKLDNLDAAISTRAAASTALSNVTWTDAKAGYLTGAVALEATLTAIKGAGWTTETLAAIDALIDAIKLKTDLIPASPAAVGSEMALADGAITAAKIATDAIDADAIKADAITEIQAGLATSANQTTILARLGAWTGSGINSILGALRAIAGKTAALTPTDITDAALTYDNTTDSLEALRDTAPMGTAMRGTDGAYTGTPPTADAIGTDAASKVLATPAQKLATDVSGRVTVGTNADKTGYALTVTPPTAADVADAVLDEAKGAHTGFLTTLAVTGADSDTLETLSDQLDLIPTAGSGDVIWPHDVTINGSPQSDVLVQYYPTSARTGTPSGQADTNEAGRATLSLSAGTYYSRVIYNNVIIDEDTVTVA